uniref:Uncharacterized protein n=1 Tax=Phlegmariurus squarrosus TaxID=73615 RepID=H9M833_PHLSQ|nr:hypothetical protein HusqMp25 [Phlegmariurus squarrosus]AEV55740.1 hypothetical protein HusqMp25 [Phlegmariurus squarrosus]
MILTFESNSFYPSPLNRIKYQYCSCTECTHFFSTYIFGVLLWLWNRFFISDSFDYSSYQAQEQCAPPCATHSGQCSETIDHEVSTLTFSNNFFFRVVSIILWGRFFLSSNYNCKRNRTGKRQPTRWSRNCAHTWQEWIQTAES